MLVPLLTSYACTNSQFLFLPLLTSYACTTSQIQCEEFEGKHFDSMAKKKGNLYFNCYTTSRADVFTCYT